MDDGVANFLSGCRSVRNYLGKWRGETPRAAAAAIGSCVLAMGAGSAFWPHATREVLRLDATLRRDKNSAGERSHA